MIYDYFRVTGAHDAVLDYADLFSVALDDDNSQEFDTRWDEVLLSMTQIPSDEMLESLYKLRTRESDQLTTVLELYDLEIRQKTSVLDCQKLKTMVKRSIDQKLRLRNFDARHGRSESGAVVKSRKEIIGVEGGKGICYQWKEKRPVFARRPLQFPPRYPRSCAKKKNTLPPHLPSQPFHEVEVSLGKIKSKSGDTCLFPDCKVDEQPKKGRRKATSQKEEKVKTKTLWLL